MSDRKTLIRLASALPKGSEERKAILAGLKAGASREEKAQTEAAKKVLEHLQQIRKILNSSGARHFGANSETRSKMEDLAEIRDHFEDLVHYLENN
jgi:hypothetical protein